MMAEGTMVAGVELGGTKAIALLARGRKIIDRITVPTGDPAETLGSLAAWLGERADRIAALGVASFGPLRVKKSAPDHGSILLTPKPGWSGTDVLAPFRSLGVPIGLDTDVNAAALAELAWGGGQGCDNLVYLTIGTGLGAGILVGGRPLHGRLHPEAGHVRPGPPSDGFAGACSFHGACIEGLISGPALARRFGQDPATLAADDKRWAAPALDLARFVSALILTVSPERVLIGGSVALGRPELIAHATELLGDELGGYLADLDLAALRQLIGAPALGADAGPLGAIRLAELVLAGEGPFPRP